MSKAKFGFELTIAEANEICNKQEFCGQCELYCEDGFCLKNIKVENKRKLLKTLLKEFNV